MKITKTQLKEIIKEELNEQAGYDYGAREYFQSLAPDVQAALDREFGEDAFIAALEEAVKNAAFGGSRMFSPQQSASEVFARLMVKRVFGGNSRWTEPAQ